jgi:hypothetical protein
VRGVFGPLFERECDHAFDVRIVDRARGSRPRLIQQAIDPKLEKTSAPLGHRLAIDTERRAHLCIGSTALGGENYARTQGQSLSGPRPAEPPVQRLAFLGADPQRLENRRRHGALLEKVSPRYAPAHLLTTNF